jgi:hypothetical protein
VSRTWRLAAALLVLATFALLCDAGLYRPHHNFTITENIQVAEAQAWWAGRLDLPERKWDSALYNGRVYSHFPPAFSFLSALAVPLFDGVPHWFLLLVVVVPIPLLAYFLMARLVPNSGDAAQRRGWCVVLAVGLVCGTSALPVLEKALRGGSPYMVNQAIALSGVLLFLVAYFGNKNVWVAGLGVVVAAWSRQMTVVYLLPLGWMIWERTRRSETESVGAMVPSAPAGAGLEEDRADHGLRCAPPVATLPGPVRGRPIGEDIPGPDASSPDTVGGRLASAHGSVRSRLARHGVPAAKLCTVAALALGVPMGLNWLKFEHPLESGYMYVYEGREDDVFVRDARAHGLFSPWYIPRNLYYANLGFPEIQRITRGEHREWYVVPNDWGTGIWWTTPLLLYLFANRRRIIGLPRERALLAGAGLAYIGLMLYHSTGFVQRGLNRYSLDYLPVLYALAAPLSVATAKRRWLTGGLIAWGVFYFSIVRHWPQVRVW